MIGQDLKEAAIEAILSLTEEQILRVQELLLELNPSPGLN